MRLADENNFEVVYRGWLEHRGLSLKEGRQTTLAMLPRIFDRDVLPTLGSGRSMRSSALIFWR